MTDIKFPRFFIMLFCFLWLVPITSNAALPTQFITSDTLDLEDFKVGYLIDTDQLMTLDNIQSEEFIESNSSASLGPDATSIWVKIELENTSINQRIIYLHNPYAFRNRNVTLYEIVDTKVTNQRSIDLDSPPPKQWMKRGSAVFDIVLLPNQHKTLYLKINSFTHQWFAMGLYDEEQSKRALLGNNTDITLIVGMISGLIIYNLLLFFTARAEENLFYACYLLSGGFWIAFLHGLIADVFNIYGSATISWHLAIIIMPIFFILFTITTFETKKKFPIEHKALVFVNCILLAQFVYGIFDMRASLGYSAITSTIMLFVSFSVSISLFIRKQPAALLFLFGHGLFVFFSSFSVLFYNGQAEFNYLNFHGVTIGIIFEALVLSLIIAYRIRTLESLKSEQAQLQELASTDPLTALFNRHHFNQVANALLNEAKQLQQPTSIVIFDIDHFKKVNDTHGHAAGDAAIVHVAKIMKSVSRKQDVLARYGGEEFIILMPNTFISSALNISERIRKELMKANISVAPNNIVKINISAGIAQVSLEDPDLKKSIEDADKALYAAKNNGRNQSKVFSQ